MAERKLTAIKGGRQARATAKPGATAARKPPGKPKRKTLLQALATGDKLAELEAMRDVVAKKVIDPKTSARDLGTLSKELREYGAQIDALKSAAKDDDGGGAEGSDDADDAPDEKWDPEAI